MKMKKNEIIERLSVDKLIFGGKGLAVLPDGVKVIISGGVIPGSVISARVLKCKSSYIEAQMLETIVSSPYEQEVIAPYEVYPGAKWLSIDYKKQLEIKSEQVKESLHHIRDLLATTTWHPIIESHDLYGYRNKLEFSFGKYISEQQGIRDEFRFGFHEQGSYDRILNFNYCALASEKVNAIVKSAEAFARHSGFETYDPKRQEGFYRHLVVREGKQTGEIMLIWSVNPPPSITKDQFREWCGMLLSWFAQERVIHSELSDLILLHNDSKADIVTGKEEILLGDGIISEKLLGKQFAIRPKSFFQVNTYTAERLYSCVRDMIRHPGGILLDLYAGTGTIGIILSDLYSEVVSVEYNDSSSEDARENARLNNVSHLSTINAKVEDYLGEAKSAGISPSTLIIDPPREGMHPKALETIAEFGAKEMIYVSCNPATLSRDLEYLMRETPYRVTDITPVDMFAHTHHIEIVVRLEQIPAE